MHSNIALCLFLIFTTSALTAPPFPTPIKHVVVLMLENRSFDHMLGYLKFINRDINGLNGNETCPVDPANPNSEIVPVSWNNTPQQLLVNPGHSVPQTTMEIFGSSSSNGPEKMNGFIKEMTDLAGYTVEEAKLVMRCFNTTSLPALSTLALEYGLFDHWYASVPGPTSPNRLYALSGTSHGATENDSEQEGVGYPQRTIIDDLYDSGKSFKVYYSDFPICFELANIRDYPLHMHTLDAFVDDCASGDLPQFSWIEPRWFDFLDWNENSQHPGYIEYYRTGNILYGEMLIKQVYEALRASPAWNDSLLVVYYDEHGGLYDHVVPPNNVPNPDGINGTSPPFDFTRLGIRVPTLLISPYINKGSVYHEPAESHYDHTSLLGTIRKIFGLAQPPLTKREAWAATFETLLTTRSYPRTDCPTTIPIAASQQEWEKFMHYQNTKPTPELVAKLKLSNPSYREESAPLSDLQEEIVRIAAGLTGSDKNLKEIEKVVDAAEFVMEQMDLYLSSKINKK